MTTLFELQLYCSFNKIPFSVTQDPELNPVYVIILGNNKITQKYDWDNPLIQIDNLRKQINLYLRQRKIMRIQSKING